MLGFEGWFLKINGTVFPNRYIKHGTYKITPDQETDLDDYTDNLGVFHRNILPAKATKIEFELPPLRLEDIYKVNQILPDNDSDGSVSVTYWNPRKLCYQSGNAYIPDVSFEPYMIYKDTNDILYNPTRIALIEYGEVR